MNISNQLPHPKFKSLDIIFEITKERVASQMEQAGALDSKASFVLGSATALISAALVLQAALLTTQSSSSTTQVISTPTPILLTPSPTLTSSPHGPLTSSYITLSANNWLYISFLILLVLVYFATMMCAFLAYRIQRYKVAPDPIELYDTYLIKEEEITKADVFRGMLKAYNENSIRIHKKFHWLNSAFLLLGFETVVLAAVLILQFFRLN